MAGRYGSTNDDGVSYTEMEYQYALKTGKPIIAFLHKDPSKIESGKCEADSEGQEKLKQFRNLAQKKMCKFWLTPEELGSVVSRSVIKLQKSSPGIGWVRGDVVSDKEASQEILKLNKQIQELENMLDVARTQAPSGSEKFAQGNDEHNIKMNFRSGSGFNELTWVYNLSVTWNEIFFGVSPSMINECSDRKLNQKLLEYLGKKLKFSLKEDKKSEENKQLDDLKISAIHNIRFDASDFETAIVQLRALGLIKKSDKNRSVKDTSTYWTLTPYGNEVMTRLRAIPKANII